MRTHFLSVLTAAALVCAVPVVGAASAQAEGTSSFEGTISLPRGYTYSDPDHPGEVYIGHVATWEDWSRIDQDFTVKVNPDGTYRADGLVPGQPYVVAVNHADLPTDQVGLLTTAYGQWTSITDSALYSLHLPDPSLERIIAPPAGTTAHDIDIMMVEGAVISGTILPADATSPWVRVCEYDSSHVGDCSEGVVDADGSFEVGVKPGNPVALYAGASGYSPTFLGGQAIMNKDVDCMPWLGVTPVLVTAPGDLLTGLTIDLIGQATITGRIVPAYPDDAWVSVTQIVDNQPVDYADATLASDGSYEIVVAAGSTVAIQGYALGFHATWIGGSTKAAASNLPDPGITQIVAPASGGTLTGVDIPLVGNGAPVAKPMLRFTLGGPMASSSGQILAVDSSGGLWGYSVIGKNKLSAGFRLGTGFSSYQVYGSAIGDVLGIKPDGSLWLFPWGYGHLEAGIKVGWGWSSSWRLIPAGDLTGDGTPDLLGIDSKGDLYLYVGRGDGTYPYPKIKVGWGWKGWNLYAAGDLNGDGKVDILGIDSKGDLYQYRGSGNAANPFPYAKQKAGWGWNGGFTMASGADLNGDGLADIVSRQTSTGNLYVYTGLGNAQFGPKTLIDTGW